MLRKPSLSIETDLEPEAPLEPKVKPRRLMLPVVLCKDEKGRVVSMSDMSTVAETLSPTHSSCADPLSPRWFSGNSPALPRIPFRLMIDTEIDEDDAEATYADANRKPSCCIDEPDIPWYLKPPAGRKCFARDD